MTETSQVQSSGKTLKAHAVKDNTEGQEVGEGREELAKSLVRDGSHCRP